MRPHRSLLLAPALLTLTVALGCSTGGSAGGSADGSGNGSSGGGGGPSGVATAAQRAVLPAPVAVQADSGAAFTLTKDTRIVLAAGSAQAAHVGDYLAGLLRPATGYPLAVTTSPTPGQVPGDSIVLDGSASGPLAAQLGDEGYQLDVTRRGVTIRAHAPAGLFHGVQTLRQLLPAAVERGPGQRAATGQVPRAGWLVPGGRITDYPRFAWRGASLDVARHFFTVAEVKRYIDDIALYKINFLHLHLTDDQGWRIAIRSWPRLADYGGGTEVGGGPGGFYTQQQYTELVNYARDRFITVVPEIDAPGHVSAALASYPQLTCTGTAPPRYTGVDVGFSSLCTDKPVIYRFLDDVIGELAALTPGPYLHIGGDEVRSMAPAAYAAFVQRVQQIVRAHGKRAIGWQEITATELLPGSLAQYWNTDDSGRSVVTAAGRGTRVVLSPANRAYLDMKYNKSTPLGQDWAGLVDVRRAYSWDPATVLHGLPGSAVAGVEAAVWSETLSNIRDVEYMVFPRLAGIAERGWSPAAGRSWDEYRTRLAAQGPRWDALGVNFYRSPQVAWQR